MREDGQRVATSICSGYEGGQRIATSICSGCEGGHRIATSNCSSYERGQMIATAICSGYERRQRIAAAICSGYERGHICNGYDRRQRICNGYKRECGGHRYTMALKHRTCWHHLVARNLSTTALRSKILYRTKQSSAANALCRHYSACKRLKWLLICSRREKTAVWFSGHTPDGVTHLLNLPPSNVRSM